jgi:hypothetical protein
LYTLDLTINYSEEQFFKETACDSYLFDGELYTMSGNYQHVYTNTAGCDSILSLDLTIVEVNVDISLVGNLLTAEAPDAEYDWINCADNISTGITTQSFTPVETGEYAVIVTTGECSDTSACVLVTIVGVEENLDEQLFQIYPNPVNDQLTINIHQFVSPVIAEILDAQGKLIYRQQIFTPVTLLQTSVLGEGLYLLKLLSGTQSMVRPFVKGE